MTASKRDIASPDAGDNGAADPEQTAPRADTDGQQNISQIRDILFGQHIAEYDRRFAQIEDRITAVTDSIKTEFVERLAAVEDALRSELAEINKDVRTDYERRVDGVQAALDGARGDLQAAIDALAKELEAHAKSFRADLRREHEHTADTIARETAQLRTDKVSATTLAALLTEVAAGLDSARESEAAAKER